MIFSKFISLDYPYKNGKYPPFLDWNKKYNKRFKEILTNWELYAPSFEKLNDIDECGYSVQGKLLYETMDKIRGLKGGDTQNKNFKKDIFICSFSHKFDENDMCENLLWAHYASNFCGVRIDFKIDNTKINNGDIIAKKDIEYTDNPTIYQAHEIENIQNTNNETLIEIMTTKSKCWEYEREHRIILTKNKIPIKIKEITLGKRFARKNYFERNANEIVESHINAIAMQIKCYLQEYLNKNQNIEMPKIYAYTTIYSPNKKEIA